MRLGALLAGLLVSAPAWAQDLPDPGMPEGAVQTAAADRGYDIYELPVGRFTSWVRAVLPLEGRVISRAFRLGGSGADPAPSSAAVMEALREGLEEQGFREVFACATEDCGGFDFRFGVAVVPAPAMVLDLSDFRQLSMRRRVGEEDVYVSLLVSRALGAVYGQSVVVMPAESPVARVPALPADEGAGPETLPSAEAEGVELLLERLLETGHVVVRGIDFETGSARVSDSSAPMLDLMAQMLTANPGLDVAVVGHSDNVGGLEVNLTLSKARARSVLEALVERGVAAGRLEAEGIAYLAPLASNATEEGRALNRRVELVLR